MTQVAPFFAEMEQYITNARKTVAESRELSLSDLDANIDKLCTMMMELSQEERMMYEPRLQELLGNLNALGLEMKAQYEGETMTQHRNASVAYQTADSRDNFGKRQGE